MSLPCLLRQSLPLITGALVSRRVAESKPWARLGLLSITIVTFVASGAIAAHLGKRLRLRRSVCDRRCGRNSGRHDGHRTDAGGQSLLQVVSDTASPSTCGQEVRWREAGVYFLILLESA